MGPQKKRYLMASLTMAMNIITGEIKRKNNRAKTIKETNSPHNFRSGFITTDPTAGLDLYLNRR